jgi:N-acetyl-anhydromuramyl-L-alanine amidase AmpD
MEETPSRIIVHCSASNFGSAAVISKWHEERGFDRIGYHYVILNGKISHTEKFKELDGVVQKGRPVGYQGAHALGHNHNSIGVCLIGTPGAFSRKQLRALGRVKNELEIRYGKELGVEMHSDLDEGKPDCPGITILNFIEALS